MNPRGSRASRSAPCPHSPRGRERRACGSESLDTVARITLSVARSPRVHPAWIVLGALAVCMMAASGIRAAFGVYIKPMEAEFGWTRSALSGVAAVSLLLLGAVGPLVGRVADRWGPRLVIIASVVVLAAGAMASAFIHSLWQAYISIGLLMAVGAGGVAMSTGASVIARWFEARRGLVLGVVGAAMSAGQLIVIPLATVLTLWFSWRASFLVFGVAVVVLVLPVAVMFIRNAPEDQGVSPYGAVASDGRTASSAALQAARVSVVEAARFPSSGSSWRRSSCAAIPRAA